MNSTPTPPVVARRINLRIVAPHAHQAVRAVDARDRRVCNRPRPDAIGLVFYPPSPRSVSVAQAVELTRDIPPFVSVVGLFVNPSPEWLGEVTRAVPLTMFAVPR